jgi:hypothetical protein
MVQIHFIKQYQLLMSDPDPDIVVKVLGPGRTVPNHDQDPQYC